MIKIILTLSAIIAIVNASDTEFYKPGLRVKYGLGSGEGDTYMYNVSRYIDGAIADGWTASTRPDGPLSQLKMYCYKDKVVCGLYDDTGYIAGLNICINSTAIEKYPFEWETRGFTKWETTVDDETVEFYCIQQYYVDEEFLSTSKEDRLADRKSNQTLQAGGVWVTGTNKELLKVSQEEADIEESIFTKQDCFNGMGQHYFYNMTRKTECTSEGMYSWFVLASKDKLVGTGMITFGKLPTETGKRDWFERPNVLVVGAIAPHGPFCLYEMVALRGIVTMHVYYVEEPTTIKCSWF